ncbi:MAG: methionyl-tRNA formyltransferase [Acidobacteriota bacterium]|nr:methionyl-tRNA formyltransferase [Acidobacteriota bacterium]
MRLVFFGTPESAVPTLEASVAAGHEIARVVTRPDRPVGRSRRPQPPPVKSAALRHGLTIEQPEKIRGHGFRETLASCAPDVLVVVAFGKILPRRLLDTGRLGAVNVHFSKLPAYRGAAPVQWALAEGNTTTGVTTMLMNERLDEGDILLTEDVAIHPGEHAPALTARLAATGATLLVRTLDGLGSGSLTPRPQDHDAASYAPILRREDGRADFSLPARLVEGRVRGFDPWPGVWAERRGRRLRLVEAVDHGDGSADGPDGRVLAVENDAAIVACGHGTTLAIRAVQFEGRRVLTVREAVNGRQLEVGDTLEPAAARA